MLKENLNETATWLRERYPHPVKAAVVLGSGLGDFATSLPNPTVIPYGEIPHFLKSRVAGHSGNLVFAEFAPGFHLACMQGRYHYYEGHDIQSVVYPIRALRSLGTEYLAVTNAAGGIHADFVAGDFMLIEDHLNLMGANPLIGPNPDFLGPRFPDMTDAYNPELRQLALQVADDLQIPLTAGVYAALSGPTYETPAEIKMLQTLGADAVGMSTVPEVIVANHMGMKVLGLSCITNLAAGIATHKLSHQEVIETGERVKPRFVKLLTGIFSQLAQPAPTAAAQKSGPKKS